MSISESAEMLFDNVLVEKGDFKDFRKILLFRMRPKTEEKYKKIYKIKNLYIEKKCASI